MSEITYPSVRSQRDDPEPTKPERAVIPSELPGGPVVNPPTELPSAVRDAETKDEQLGLFTENKRP